jgi:hypothetical protein
MYWLLILDNFDFQEHMDHHRDEPPREGSLPKKGRFYFVRFYASYAI